MFAGLSGVVVAAVAVFALVFVAPAAHRAFSVVGGLEAHDCPGGPIVATIPATDVVVLAGWRYDGRFGHWSAVTWDDSRGGARQTRVVWVTDDAFERALGTAPSREGGKVFTDPAFDTCTPTPPTVLGTVETRVSDTQARTVIVTDAPDTAAAITSETVPAPTTTAKKSVATTTTVKPTATVATTPTTVSTTSSTSTTVKPATTTTSTTTPKIVVPDLLNLPQQDAEQKLTDLGLKFTVLPAFLPKGDSRDGLVVSQLPAAGSAVDPGTKVSIAIGQAPKVIVPNVVGAQSLEGQDALHAAGLDVQVVYDPQSNSGEIVAQSPVGGSSVPEGTTVTITVDDEAPCCATTTSP